MYGEVRTSLKTVQLVIEEKLFIKNTSRCQDDRFSNNKERLSQQGCKIAVAPDKVTISRSQQGPTTVFIFPPNLELLPQSCTAIDWVEGDGLHARIKLSGDELQASHDVADDAWTLNEGQERAIVCRTCGQHLTSKTLTKVTHLPSDNWEGIVEELWCCRSKDLAGTPPHPLMTPTAGECLLGSFDVILASQQMLEEAVDVQESETVNSKSRKSVKQMKCSRCHSMLGTCQEHVLGQSTLFHLWKFQTALLSIEDRIQRRNSTDLERLVARYLKTQSENDVCFKYMVESEDHQAQILLWLISSDSVLLLPEPAPHRVEEGGVSTTCVNIHCQQIIKVLYQTCWDEKGQELRDEWNHDMMVQSFILPLNACYTLAEMLIASTRSTPPSMRHLNDLTVGYLKTS